MKSKTFQWQSAAFVETIAVQELFISLNQCILLCKERSGSICKVVHYDSDQNILDWHTAENWLIAALQLLQLDFHPTLHLNIRVANVPFVLIPEGLYSPEHKASYLLTASKAQNYFSTQSDTLEILKQTCVYEVPNYLLRQLSEHNFQYSHWTSLFLSSLPKTQKSELSIHAILFDRTLTISVVKQGELLFMNEFLYVGAVDVLYYVLAVYNQHGLDPLNQELTVFGQINQLGEVFTDLKKYIANIHLVKEEALPAEVNYYNYLFSTITI